MFGQAPPHSPPLPARAPDGPSAASTSAALALVAPGTLRECREALDRLLRQLDAAELQVHGLESTERPALLASLDEVRALASHVGRLTSQMLQLSQHSQASASQPFEHLVRQAAQLASTANRGHRLRVQSQPCPPVADPQGALLTALVQLFAHSLEQTEGPLIARVSAQGGHARCELLLPPSASPSLAPSLAAGIGASLSGAARVDARPQAPGSPQDLVSLSVPLEEPTDGELDAEVYRALPESTTDPTRGGLPQVLIVDDEPAILRAMVRSLRGLVHIDTALGGEAALERLQAQDYDLMLFDYRMPDIDGRSLYLSLSPSRQARVVFVTAGAPDAEGSRFLQTVPVMHKPFRPSELRAMVLDRLRRAEARAQP